MPTMLNRKHGCYYPGTTGTYTLEQLEYLLGTPTGTGTDVVGRRFDMYVNFMSFDSVTNHTEYAAAATAGKTLCIAWQPSRTAGLTFADILAGVYDSHINTWLDYWGSLRGPDGTTKAPVVLRFGHEMNGSFMQWSPLFSQSATNSSHVLSAAQFVQVWQYMVGKQRAHATANTGGNGATNVKWFFCANQNDTPGSGGIALESFYPGSSYVDIVGFDSYNGLNGVWMTPTQTFSGFTNGTQANTYDRVAALHPTAEIWIGETGCVDVNDVKDTGNIATGHSKAQWYADAFAIDAATLPRLTTVCWFDASGTRNWKFDSSDNAKVGFKTAFEAANTTTIPFPASLPSNSAPLWGGYGMPFPEAHDPARDHRAEHSAFKHFLNQVTNITLGGWNQLVGNSDGTGAAVRAVVNALGTTAQAALKVETPLGTRRAISFLVNAIESFAIDSDGRLRWGDGTNAVDTSLFRSGANALTASGALTVTGAFSAGSLTQSQSQYLPQALPTKPATGAGAIVFGIADTVKVQTPDLLLTFQQSPADIHKMWLSIDPGAAASTYLPPQGTLWLAKMAIPEAVTLSQIGVNVTTAGGTLTAGTSCLGVVYDTSGNLLGTTADQATAWQSTGEKRATLTAVGSLTVKPGYVYAGVMASGTTNPTFSAAVGGPNNWNLAASQGRALTNSSALTAAPATITIGNSGLSTRLPFVALK